MQRITGHFPGSGSLPVVIDEEWIREVRKPLPELQPEKMERYQKEYGLSGYDSRIITESRKLSDLFEQTTALCGLPKTANWLIGETSRLMKENVVEADQLIFSPEHLASLIRLTESGSINTTIAKEGI